MQLPDIHSSDELHLMAVCAHIALQEEEMFYHIQELEQIDEQDLEEFRDKLEKLLKKKTS